MSNPQLLAPIELRMEPVPPRTRVTRLNPRGLGTLMVECLTSFLMRLAAAHHLPTGVLATRVLRPAPAHRPTLPGEMPKVIMRDLRWANGVNAQASDWVEVVFRASGVDVRDLTLLPWAPVLPAIELVDGFIRHCPVCLTVMLRQGEVYEPLLWSLLQARVCPIHDRPLEEHCPACGRRQEAIGYRSRVGLCRWCGIWLGGPRRRRIQTGSWDRWVSGQLAELVVGPPRAPDADRVRGAVDDAIATLGCAQKDVAAAIGHARSSVSKWRSGKGRPSLAGVLRLSALGDWSACAFLDGRLVRQMGPGIINPSPWGGRARKDWRRIEREVRQAVSSAPPPTLRSVARAAGVDIQALRERLPQRSAQIVQRRRDWDRQMVNERQTAAAMLIDEAVALLRAAGIDPSRRAVEAQLPKPLSLREPALQAVWKEARSGP